MQTIDADQDLKIYDSIVIGAGQSGLAIAYYLKQLGRDFLMLDQDVEIGGSWLNRWDSLKLFTPTEFNDLPGKRFPAAKGHYPSKYDVASYLKDYVETYSFEVELEQVIQKIEKDENDIFHISSNAQQFRSKEVIIATGPFHIPFVPKFCDTIDSSILQMHSSEYKSPNQLKDGPICVVGAGDSGVQIAEELSESTSNRVYISCSQHSFPTLPQEFLGKTLWWWLTYTGLLSVKVDTAIGKYLSNQAQPVIGTDVKGLFAKANVQKVGTARRFSDGKLYFDGDASAEVENIIWATGYKPDFSMLKFDQILNHKGYPKNKRGISAVPGLYFIGLPWMYTRGSATLGGVKKDAKYLFQHMMKQSI